MIESFESQEFLVVADQTCAVARARSPDEYATEAWVRTAVGRAYYGFYLVVRSAIMERHRIAARRLTHGALYTHLQNSRGHHDLRAVGRHLEHLYSFRRHADYELDPDEVWRSKLRDPNGVSALAIEAHRLSLVVPRLDFTPVVHLF